MPRHWLQQFRNDLRMIYTVPSERHKQDINKNKKQKTTNRHRSKYTKRHSDWRMVRRKTMWMFWEVWQSSAFLESVVRIRKPDLNHLVGMLSKNRVYLNLFSLCTTTPFPVNFIWIILSGLLTQLAILTYHKFPWVSS